MPHNGGRSQINPAGPQTGMEYPFINHFKTAQEWVLVNGVEPSQLDANGYPTSFSGGQKVYTVFWIPSQADRPGNWHLRWLGNGTFNVYGDGTYTTHGGALSGTDGQYLFRPAGTISGGGHRVVFEITATNGGNPIRHAEIVHQDDIAEYDAGAVFTRKYKETLLAPPFGVVRFLNWQGTNQSNEVLWAHRKPLTYAWYSGPEIRPSIYAGTTTNSGDDYSATLSGFTLVHGAMVTLKFGATAAGTTPRLNVSSTGLFPIKEGNGVALSTTTKPAAGAFATLIYDAELQVWMKYGGYDNGFFLVSGWLQNGVPPELCVRLCNEIGAHPWLHVPLYAVDEPTGNYATNLFGYVRDNLNPGLRPFAEPVNETWNSIFAAYEYANVKSTAWLGAAQGHEWYGRALSRLGAQLDAVYSGDRSRFQLVCGMQTYGYGPDFEVRLTSPAHVTLNGGQPAKSYVPRVAIANYWNSTHYGQATELTMATEYATASEARKAELIHQYVSANTLTELRTQKFPAWQATAAAHGCKLTAYEGGYSPDYLFDWQPNAAVLNPFRRASKTSPLLPGYALQNYRDCAAVGIEYPSHFQLGSDAWGLFEPNIYATPSPQWDAILEWNRAPTPARGSRRRPNDDEDGLFVRMRTYYEELESRRPRRDDEDDD